MKRPHKRKPDWQRGLAQERIAVLLQQAEERYPDALAHRYAQLARRIQMRYKVRLTPQQRRRVCKRCFHFLKLGRNCRIRLTKSKASYTCLDCGQVMRYPYLREQKARRKAK